jgi:hypothetical protein
MTFDVVITSLTPTPANDRNLTDQTLTQVQTAIVLTAGDTYEVVLTGYNSTHTTPIARWTDPSVAISTGSVETLNANLIGIVDGTNEGYFTYSVLVPSPATLPGSNYDVGSTMDVVKYGEVATTTKFNGGSPIVLTGATVTGTSVPLDSGFYTITITLKKANYQDRVVTNVMHIYPALTSTFTYAVPEIKKNVFDVDFDLGSVVDDSGSAFATGGKDTQLVNNAGTILDPGDPEDEDGLLEFDGWYYENTFATLWSATDKIFKDTTLYAKWKADEGVEIILTFTISDANIVQTGSTPPVSYNDLAGTAFLTFTLSGTFTGVTWDLDGTSIGTGNSITINSSSSFLAAFVTGKHIINVHAMDGATPYSAYIEFEIDND